MIRITDPAVNLREGWGRRKPPARKEGCQPIDPWRSHDAFTLRTLAAAGAVAAAVGTGVALAAPSSAAGTSQVSVLHGVPGLTVDVYANGNKLLSDFKPGTLTDPVALPEGTYDLKVFAAGKGPTAPRRSRPRASRCRPARTSPSSPT